MRTPDARLVEFGRAVRRARRDRDMSQEELAEAAGLAAKHLSEIERANRDVRLTTFLHIARGLDLRPSELMALVERRFEGD